MTIVTKLACINLVGANELQFFGVNRLMILRAISKPPVPDYRPHHADRAKLEEGQSPALQLDELEYERRADRGADCVADERYAQCAALMRRGKPPGDAARDVRERACLARAEQESHQHQRGESCSRAGESCEDGPPQHDASERSTSAEVIAEPSAWNLKHGISQSERAEDVAHLRGREVKRVSYRGRGCRDAESVEISDVSENEEQRKHFEPCRSGTLLETWLDHSRAAPGKSVIWRIVQDLSGLTIGTHRSPSHVLHAVPELNHALLTDPDQPVARPVEINDDKMTRPIMLRLVEWSARLNGFQHGVTQKSTGL